MITVEDINKTFAEKGVYIELPLPPDRVVKSIEILEKQTEGDNVKLLLNVKFIDESGRDVSDILFCHGRTTRKRIKKTAPPPLLERLKSEMLTQREKSTFENEAEAETYIKEAISHLLQDKGYHPIEQGEIELYFEKEGRGFFINLAVRLDEKAVEKAKGLVELRRKHGSSYDYGLVIPAFQESLGLPLHAQERWMFTNGEYLSAHHIGVYAVDNLDPNRIYPFTIYPGVKELMRYFMTTTQQWLLIRSRYVVDRARKRDSN
ncbi:MAG: hypothetical protein SU899_05640 [Chloroflexota bacterium]|nr:hypothetical protein [Chloroflexota bacterium]